MDVCSLADSGALPDVGMSRQLVFLLFAVRLLRLLRTLARAIRSAYVIRVFVVFLHDDVKIKQHFSYRKSFSKILDTQR